MNIAPKEKSICNSLSALVTHLAQLVILLNFKTMKHAYINEKHLIK